MERRQLNGPGLTQQTSDRLGATIKTGHSAPALPTVARTDGRPRTAAPPAWAPNFFRETVDYQRDLFERTILFWDTLRQRAGNMIAHDRAGKPPLLDFDYEVLLDARRFAHPANYALLRITRVGDACFEDCFDETKPPVIIVDPRAGHGPGIGGFKRESEVGMAMHEGHPVYFVVFFPEPCPGQMLADVHHALRRFVEDVATRHPGKPPVLYGNCQAGWKVLYEAERHHTLAASGAYAYVRHPQYVGFVMVIFGFLLQWPTLLTLAMFPVLVFMYVRLARLEEREALADFGVEYERYMRDVPAFLPRLSDLAHGPRRGRTGHV